MKNGNKHFPFSPPSRNPQLAILLSMMGHKACPMTQYYTSNGLIPHKVIIDSPPRKIIADHELRLNQLDTWAILNATARLKDEKFLLNELQTIEAKLEPPTYPSVVVLIDRHGRPAVPESTLSLFRKALKPGIAMYGRKKMHVDVWVLEELWEVFLIAALGWWVDSGTAPERMVELRLELDLGL